MEKIIPRYFELRKIHTQLKGKTQDEIPQEFGKSQGTISNIISRMIMIGVIMMLILRGKQQKNYENKILIIF